MLTIITGRVKSGKSEYCSRAFAAYAAGAGGSALGSGAGTQGTCGRGYFIVPEQYTMDAEKRILALESMRGKCLFESEVLSFKRLVFRILSRLGGGAGDVLDARGRVILLASVLAQLEPELRYFKGISRRPASIRQLLALFDEFEAYNSDRGKLGAALGAACETAEGTEKVKFAELSRIFGEFQERVDRSYLSGARAWEKAVRAADEAGFFRNTAVWIDEFSGFTDLQFELIACMLRGGADVTVSLCTSRRNEQLFYSIDRTLDRLKAVGTDAGSGCVVRSIEELLPGAGRYGNAFLRALEQAYTGLKPAALGIAAPEGTIELVSAEDMFAEVNAAADKIAALSRAGVGYGEIVLGMRNPGDYAPFIGPVFERAGIPYFLDEVRPVGSNPVIVTVKALLDLYIYDMRPEDVCRLLKNRMTLLSGASDDELENLVLERKLRGSRKYRNAGEQFQKLYEVYTQLKDRFARARTVSAALNGFAALLRDLGLEDTAEAAGMRLEADGQTEKAEEFLRIWNILLELFELIRKFLGDEPAPGGTETARQLKNYIETGIEGIEIGHIPQEADAVRVAGIGRSRIGSPKAILLIGVNEGVMPASDSEKGIVKESERELLVSSGVGLADNSLSRAYKELFMIYSALFSASEQLWLSCARRGGTGEKLLRSDRILKRLETLVPGLKMREYTLPLSGAADAGDNAIDAAGDNADAVAETGEIDIAAAAESSEFDTAAADESNEFDTAHTFLADPELAKRLLGMDPHLSVSQIEAYNACPLAYFMNYGLGLKERPDGELHYNDLGTLMHDTIEQGAQILAAELRSGTRGLTAESEELREYTHTVAAGCFDKALDKLYHDFDSVYTPKERLLMDRLREFSGIALYAVGNHCLIGRLTPLAFECRFGTGAALPPITTECSDGSGRLIYVSGKIDRLDMIDDGANIYISVVDYKSSEKEKLYLPDVAQGLDVQLITYLKAVSDTQESRRAVLELAKSKAPERVEALQAAGAGDALPAAGLYFTFGSGISQLDKGKGKDLKTVEAEQFSMKGLIVAGSGVTAALNGGTDDKIVATGNSTLLAPHEFAEYSGQVDRVIAGTCARIEAGVFGPMPKTKRSGTSKKKTECEHCNYKAVCGFTNDFGGQAEEA